MALPNIDEVKKNYEDQVKKFQQAEKEREKIILNRQQLEAQLTENQLVKQELENLGEDANVFKLIGPALVKQDLKTSKEDVNNRLEYINGQIKSCENNIESSEKALAEAKKKVEDALKKVQVQLGAK